MATVYLSLGSNVEPEKHLAAALRELRERFGALIVSPVYRTPAVGFEGPAFLNFALAMHTSLDPVALDQWLHALEDRQGRRRDVARFSSRTLDIDIVLYDQLILDGPGHLQLPRAELEKHAFVLKPMVDIAAQLVHPVRKRSLQAIWEGFEQGAEAIECLGRPEWLGG